MLYIQIPPPHGGIAKILCLILDVPLMGMRLKLHVQVYTYRKFVLVLRVCRVELYLASSPTRAH